jgi:hypothetical protein
MKNIFGRMVGKASRKVGRRGFTLAEVILGSVVIGSFVSGTIYMAAEISNSRIGGLAQRDRNAWANIQTQLAAEGIDASSTNGSIWEGKRFDGVLESSLDVETSSAGVGTQEIGECVVVRPFRIDLSTLNLRTNLRTVGFKLMDHETGTATAAAMDKDDTFSAAATFAIVKYNPDAAGYYVTKISDGGTGFIDAWNDINWEDEDGPAIYIVAKSNREGMTDLTLSQDGGGSISMGSNTIPGLDGWTYGVKLDEANFTADSSVALNYSATSESGDVTTGSVTVAINKIVPSVYMTVLNADGSSRLTNTVTLADVLPQARSLSAAQKALIGSGSLYVGLYGEEPFEEANRLPDALDGKITVTNTIGSYTFTSTSGSSSTGFEMDVPAVYGGYQVFGSTADHTWRTNITSTSPYVANTTKNSTLTPVPSLLPEIDIQPPSSDFYTPYVEVTMSPKTSLFPTISDAELGVYDIRYTTDGTPVTQASPDYASTILVGRSITYFMTQTVRARAFNRYSQLSTFLQQSAESSAVYTKTTDPDNPGDYWNYGTYEDGINNDTVTRQKWSDSVHIATPSIASSWLSGVVPNAADRNVFFLAVRPDNGQVTIDSSYKLGGLFLMNDLNFDLINYGSLTFERTEEDNVELTVSMGDNHFVRAPMTLSQPMVVNTVLEDNKVTITEFKKSAASSHGVYKMGAGTLVVNTPTATSNPSGSTANQQHQIRFVVEDGTLQLGQDNAINRIADDAEQAGVVLDGGRFDMNGKDQTFDLGIFTGTNPSSLRFGGGSELYPDNVSINSRSKLNIYNYNDAYYDLLAAQSDYFYSKYPGLATLRRIVYPELQYTRGDGSRWRNEEGLTVTARWRGTSTTSKGEIVPRRPPTSTGFAYLTVTRTSRIFFEGSVKLSVQDIAVYDGCVLEVRDWDNSDLFTVECEDGTDTTFDINTNDTLTRIQFYNSSGTALGTGARLETITVDRPSETDGEATICRILPNN